MAPVGHGLFPLAAPREHRVDHPLTLAPLDVPGLLKRFGLRPDKRLGQNFLVDNSALQKVVEVAGITPQDHVLEIGPGLGSLTRYLASLAYQVVAVELDHRLFPVLREVLFPFSNLRLVQGDILALDPANLIDVPGYLVVANIPYYITSALIRHLLETDYRPKRLVLTVQQEVAKRICASPGDMSLLALSIQLFGSPRVEAHISSGAFYPAPKVDSSVIRVELYGQPLIPNLLIPDFFRLVRAGFSQKRKTLRNALAGGLAWSPSRTEALLYAANIDPGRRAETLNFDEWGILVEKFRDYTSDSEKG